MAHLPHGQIWTEQEDAYLLEAASTISPLEWQKVADLVEQKFENAETTKGQLSRNQCRKRYKKLVESKDLRTRSAA